MSAYLDIAQQILSRVEVPLSAKQIMDLAYVLNVVPVHLYGRTQHKTLHARLSEHIITKGERSRFKRTGPGRFVLNLKSSFNNQNQSQEDLWQKEYIAPRIEKDLGLQQALCFRGPPKNLPPNKLTIEFNITAKNLFDNQHEFGYLRNVIKEGKFYVCAVLTIVSSDMGILVYKAGRFRTRERIDYGKKRIGFVNYLSYADFSLLHDREYAFTYCAHRTLAEDLFFRFSSLRVDPSALSTKALGFIWVPSERSGGRQIVAVVHAHLSAGFDLHRRILAFNDLRWMSVEELNNVFGWDDWSEILCRTPAFVELLRGGGV